MSIFLGIDIVEIGEATLFQHGRRTAKFAHQPHRMADNHRSRPLHPALEKCIALGAKGGIADGGDLIHQISVKLNSHRHAKGQSRLHAGRIGAEGQVKMRAEFGKILRKCHKVIAVDAVDPGHEADILGARQIAMK